MFLSADKVQGNLQGMDPYTYVGGNPETRNDPTGQMFIGAGNNDGHYVPPPPPPPPPPPQNSCNFFCNLWNGTKAVVSTVSDLTLGIPSMISDVQTIFNGNASLGDKLWAGADLLMNVGMNASILVARLASALAHQCGRQSLLAGQQPGVD